MTIQNFFTSRDNNANANSYVGQQDRLWYNIDLNAIYVSDGNTPGGLPVGLATGANAIFNNITVNTISTDDSSPVVFITEAQFNEGATVDVGLTVTGDVSVTGNITPAAPNKIGGIAPGPGVVISNQGILTIDTANLPLSFGDFTASNNILTIVNVDEDMILATQGNAEIQMVGNIGFYKSNGLPPDPNNQYFFARDDGQLRILVPVEDPVEGGVEIIGSATGTYITPGAPGTMLQLTGNPDVPCRVYHDSLREYSSYVARRYNGTTAAPGQVLANQDVFRINATAATNAGMGNVAHSQIRFTALENQTTTAQGSEISFYATAIGSPAANRVEVANITVANGVMATQFTTAGNISATGNIAGGNLTLSGGGIISSTGLISTTGNIAAGNVNSYVTLPAGVISQAPLRFTAGVLQTLPDTGAMNFDGTVFYATPQGSERGLIVTEQVFIPNLDFAIVNQTAVQSMFGAITTVSSNTRYAYRIMSTIYKTANNISLQFATGGNAVVAKHTYQTLTTATAALATASTPTVVKNVLTAGFDTPVTVSGTLNGTGYYGLEVTGTINITTAGTWFPQIGFTGLPGAGSYVAGGSSIEIWPIGPAGANVSIGNWS